MDLRTKTMTLFNDRYGMSRIYFHQGKDEFLFASEAKALLKVRPDLRAIQPAALAQYLRYSCVVGGQTLFKDICLLPNASSWTFKNSVVPKKTRYFDETEWERQSALQPMDFYEKFDETVMRVFPRYIEGSQNVALALTAGLDTRMIASALHACGRPVPCYTFGTVGSETFDIRGARQIAGICNTPYEVINIDEAFFRDFPWYARANVYLSDGTHDAFGAHDVYLNKIARGIAPVRLTGKFGSEVVKNRRLIRWATYNDDFVQPDLKPFLNQLEPRDRLKQRCSLSNAVFEEIPWCESGRVAIEQSQLILRTPYLDNDLVKLMFQAPSEVRAAGQLQPNFIRQNSPDLSTILTNLGEMGDSGGLVGRARYVLYRVLFKMEYIYLYAAPHWSTWVDRRLKKFKLERVFAGREKFERYRLWIGTFLAEFIQETLLDSRAEYGHFLNRKSVEKMVTRHIAGTHNYLREINKALTIQLICSSLLKA